METIVPVQVELPADIELLAAAADAEGVPNMRKLISAWRSGEQRFDRNGAALFAAYAGRGLAGVGGVKPELNLVEPAMRMHRFFVHPSCRRLGIGRRLAQAVMTHALSQVEVLTCHAHASSAAAPFWESLGFQAVNHPHFTHLFRPRARPATGAAVSR